MQMNIYWRCILDTDELCLSGSASVWHAHTRRFTFELSPGQTPLQIQSPFMLVPSKGVFVRPVLREHVRAEE